MDFINIASGSKGNCTLVSTKNTTLMIDDGINIRTLSERVRLANIDLKKVSAILITHEHSDHVGALSVWKQHNDTPIYAHRICAPSVECKCGISDICRFDDSFSVGDVKVDFIKFLWLGLLMTFLFIWLHRKQVWQIHRFLVFNIG